MEAEFWHERWREQRIGFHLEKVNPTLLRHWPVLNPAPGSRVFVPLCGKTLDIGWLLDQGHKVCGIDCLTCRCSSRS